jgi:hypothetical protein
LAAQTEQFVTLRSVAAMWFDTSPIPDTKVVRRATLRTQVRLSDAFDADAHTRNMGIQWANAAVLDGLSIADYPMTFTADAYDGPPVMTMVDGNDFEYTWSFALTAPGTVSVTGRTGLFIAPAPDASAPPAGEWFDAYLHATDYKTCVSGASIGARCIADINTQNPPAGCGGGATCPGCCVNSTLTQLDVYYCDAGSPTATATRTRTPTVTNTPTVTATASHTPTFTVTPTPPPLIALVPTGHVAVVPNVGDIAPCVNTPAAGPRGTPYVCAVPTAAVRIALVPFDSQMEIPNIAHPGPLKRCTPGAAIPAIFLCRTTPTPGTTRVQVGQVGVAAVFDTTSDWGMCTTASFDYLCVVP